MRRKRGISPQREKQNNSGYIYILIHTKELLPGHVNVSFILQRRMF